jgi:hypothetical protein
MCGGSLTECYDPMLGPSDHKPSKRACFGQVRKRHKKQNENVGEHKSRKGRRGDGKNLASVGARAAFRIRCVQAAQT